MRRFLPLILFLFFGKQGFTQVGQFFVGVSHFKPLDKTVRPSSRFTVKPTVVFGARLDEIKLAQWSQGIELSISPYAYDYITTLGGLGSRTNENGRVTAMALESRIYWRILTKKHFRWDLGISMITLINKRDKGLGESWTINGLHETYGYDEVNPIQIARARIVSKFGYSISLPNAYFLIPQYSIGYFVKQSWQQRLTIGLGKKIFQKKNKSQDLK